MKDKIQALLFGVAIIIYLSISTCIADVEATSLIFPIILKPLTQVNQPQSSEPEQDEQSGIQPDAGKPDDGPSLCLFMAASIGGSMLNGNARSDLYNTVITILSELFGPQDMFSLSFYHNPRTFTTVPTRIWSAEVKSLLDALFHLRLKGGDKTFFSLLLAELIRTVAPGNVLLIISEDFIDAGARAEDAGKCEQAFLVVDTITNAAVNLVLMLHHIRAGDNPHQGLAGTLQAKIVTHWGAPSVYMICLPEIISGGRDILEPPTLGSNAHPLVWTGIVLVSFLFTVRFVIIRRLKPTPYTLVNRYSYYMLRVSWDSPFEGSEELPINGLDTEITIGGDEADTVYSPDLVAGHIKVEIGEDILALTCHGPVRLEDGTVVKPFGKESAVSRFPINQDVNFSAGEVVFALKRIKYTAGSSDDCEPVL